MDGRVQDLRLGRLWSSSVRNAAQHRSDFATVGPWIGREGFLGFLRQFLDALQELRDGRHLDSPHQAPTKRRHAFSEMHHSGSRAIRCPPPKRSQSSLFPRKYGICNRLPPIALPSIRSRQSRSGDSGYMGEAFSCEVGGTCITPDEQGRSTEDKGKVVFCMVLGWRTVQAYTKIDRSKGDLSGSAASRLQQYGEHGIGKPDVSLHNADPVNQLRVRWSQFSAERSGAC
ncbi:hypothetical protein AXG93_2891s1420 [Marchantia polymorpha subsp. ruderalis]|uniref:Uncharacterized protein n=1 Tax=Marchantia polymorpha subsp. ruderalis TaxID=1480154 RepID=A0A176WLS7_MARPO|nr:hypothetical protein AXG93_2891s1420 [Marchantia polymorpha subsp. ruderalis]